MILFMATSNLLQIGFFIVFALILALVAKKKNRSTSMSFSSKEYLVEGEKEISVIHSVYVSQRFIISWLALLNADVYITNKRVIIYSGNSNGIKHIYPSSIFYTQSDLSKYGGKLTSYLFSDIKTENGKTIIKSSASVLKYTWKVSSIELESLVNEAKKIT